ncbi:hypothetical protein OAO55_02790 [Bacteroidales bacterium]|nr:hypothetical protein [Bacteroidales bacterium]
MEVKGTAVKSIGDYVRNNFKDRYEEWVETLSEDSREIISTSLSNKWYPLKEAIVDPTRQIGMLFFNGDTQKAAYECGKYSAFVALNGIYKLYVKFSSPGHVVDRGSRILPAYYNPSKIKQTERTKQHAKFEMVDCEGIDEVVEYRIAGWMYKALEISGCKTMSIEITESIKTHGRTVFDCNWS